MGIYRGRIVPLNVGQIERKFQKFLFRPFTLKKINKVIDNLDNNKAPGPGYINAWARSKNDTGAAFLDLAKAFNSISHEIFLQKAENFKLSLSIVLLLKSFLANRTQCVKLGIDLSDKITIDHGVLQGTILGPLIFLLYVNDFSEKVEGEKDVVQFADDIIIILKFERHENIPQKIEKILEKTDKYLTAKQFNLKADKTEMLFFTNHTNSDPEFSFKEEVIKPPMPGVIWGHKLIQS